MAKKGKREKIKLESTANGARVKTYSSNDGDGHVRNITWTDVEMHDVHDCIVVTDAYKKIDGAKHHVKVSDLHFENVKGDGCGGDTPVSFVCTSSEPCTGIELRDVKMSTDSRVEMSRI